MGVEDGSEGALTGIAATYLAHAEPSRVRLMSIREIQPRLGESVVFVQADPALAVRIFEGFENKVSAGCKLSLGGGCSGRCTGACARRVVYACSSDDPSMPEALHRYIRKGFTVGSRIRNMLSHPEVAPLVDIARAVSAECERTRQFVRFSRVRDGSYFSIFRPKADTIPLTAGFFRKRMGTERFCLLDPVHKVAAFHDSHLAVVRLDDNSVNKLIRHADIHVDERYIQSMWKLFYDSVELEGRRKEQRGYDLRCQFMPKRLWEGLPELDGRLAGDPGTAPQRYAGTRDASGPELTGGAARSTAALPASRP